MLKMKRILGLAAAMSLVAGAALSATFSAEWSVDANDLDPGLVIGTDPDSGNFSVELEVGGSETVDLFVIFTDETWVHGDDTIDQPIEVAFSFWSPVSSGTVGGTTDGVRTFFGVFQAGVVTFDGPETFTFGSGDTGEFTIELNDAIFNFGVFGLDEGVQNGAQISATLTYVTAAVPLPAGGVLLLTALGAAAALRRRKAVAA